MDRSEIIDKVKKCLRLGASSNEHESAAALRQAKLLMDKYQISDDDLALSDVGETAAKINQQSSPPAYLVGLMNTVADLMGCQIFVKPGYPSGEVVFIGVSPNDELASYAFDTLSRKLEKARKEFIATELKYVRLRSNKTKRADAYCTGWVYAVHNAIESLKVPIPEIVGTYMVHTHRDLVKSKSRRRVSSSTKANQRDLVHGFGDGEHVDLNKPVAGESQARLQ